jgi:hypothetical protein
VTSAQKTSGDPPDAATMTKRRTAEAFSIRDAADRAVCHVYFEDEPARRQAMRRFTEVKLRQIAQTIARMLTDADDAGNSIIPLDDMIVGNEE